jgi:hypothetical protein
MLLVTVSSRPSEDAHLLATGPLTEVLFPMKSLIKKRKVRLTQCCAPKADPKVAQCCAKVSTAVAGCHD